LHFYLKEKILAKGSIYRNDATTRGSFDIRYYPLLFYCRFYTKKTPGRRLPNLDRLSLKSNKNNAIAKKGFMAKVSGK
jgi:hypothetical protein